MLTPRGWWLLSLSALATLIGATWAAWWSGTVPLLGLSLLAWLLVEWVVFAYRFRASADRLRVDRVLLQGGRTVPAVWAGGTFTVRVTVTLCGTARLPFVHLADRPPPDLAPVDGSHAAAFDLRPGEPVVIEYQLRAESPGVVRFEGVQVRVADVAGLFYRRLFVRQPVEFLVLPPLTNDQGKHRGTKRFNTLPPPGVHRLRRPGSGNELLDLRDYQPGDPPKMIAWKPSAKRDTLITKEIENEVPVRSVIFLDASNGARVGPPGRAPVVRAAEVAAALAQAAGANRDLVGLTVFDETTADVTAPARTRTHVIQLLRKLGEAAARLPDPGHTDPDLLARYAHPVAQQLYPDLTAREVNSLPFGLYWLPIADSRWLWLVLALFCFPMVLIRPEAIEFVARAANTFSGPDWDWLARIVLVLAIVLFFPALAGLIWFLHGVRGLLPPRSVRTARRKQLAALYAALDASGPGAVERHLYDDESFADRTTRFLLDHRVRLPLVLHDEDGRYRFRSERKVQVLANAIVRSVARARDNELYVILADLTELADELRPLVQAAQVARARHHQVLVLLPWPADVPPPPDRRAGKRVRDGSMKSLRIGNLVKSVLVSRYHRAYAELRTVLAKAGATVVRVEDGDPVRLVLDRLDRIRGTRVRR
ncbi:MAG TPA: DUF58 domain-containing protein [Fimbriiglobus sp.]|nr:DUF58 domain-containing protein [Fimbriiglobus sp.]